MSVSMYATVYTVSLLASAIAGALLWEHVWRRPTSRSMRGEVSNTPIRPRFRFWTGQLPDMLVPGRTYWAMLVRVGRWRLEVKRDHASGTPLS